MIPEMSLEHNNLNKHALEFVKETNKVSPEIHEEREREKES